MYSQYAHVLDGKAVFRTRNHEINYTKTVQNGQNLHKYTIAQYLRIIIRKSVIQYTPIIAFLSHNRNISIRGHGKCERSRVFNLTKFNMF